MVTKTPDINLTTTSTPAKNTEKPLPTFSRECVTNGKRLNTAIKAYAKKAATLDTALHTLAVDCLKHAEAYGDARPLDSLCRHMGKSQRVKGLMVWAETFSPVRWNGDKKVGLAKATKPNGDENKSYCPFDVPKAEATPFWTMEAASERTAKPLTFEALVNMVKRLETRVEKEASEGKTTPEDAAKITAVLKKFEKAVA